MPRTAEDYAKEAMKEVIEAGVKATLQTTQEPSRRYLYECAAVHLDELVNDAELDGDDTIIEAAQDAV